MRLRRQVVRLAAYMGLEDLSQGKVQKKQPVPNASPREKFFGNDQIFLGSVAPEGDLLYYVNHVCWPSTGVQHVRIQQNCAPKCLFILVSNDHPRVL